MNLNKTTINKIDNLIEEAGNKHKNFSELNTIQQRALATTVKNLNPDELKNLRKISTRLKIAVKNGLIDGTIGAAVLGAIGAAVGGPAGATIGASIGGAIGVSGSAGHNYNKAKNIADLKAFGGKEELKELQKEFQGMFGKTISDLLAWEGKIRFSN